MKKFERKTTLKNFFSISLKKKLNINYNNGDGVGVFNLRWGNFFFVKKKIQNRKKKYFISYKK